MNKKAVISLSIIFIAIITAFYLSLSETKITETVEKQEISESTISQISDPDNVIVYYFYSRPGCITCHNIERYTKETVESLNNSKVIFTPLEVKQPQNSHYISKYNLFTNSVILSKIKDEKEVEWKNIDGMWTKLRNDQDFKNYITSEINLYLGD